MAPALFARFMRSLRKAAKLMNDAAWEATETGNNLTERQADKVEQFIEHELGTALTAVNDAACEYYDHRESV